MSKEKFAEVMTRGGMGKSNEGERKPGSTIPGTSKYLVILSRLSSSYAEGRVRPWEFKQGNFEAVRKGHEKVNYR